MRIKYLGPPGPKIEKHVQLLVDLQIRTFGSVIESAKMIPESHWWIVEDEDRRPGGFAGLFEYDDRKRTGFLCLAGIIPRLRGQGLQRRLIRVRERRAKILKLSRLISYTASDNVTSANNLLACGFRLYTPRWEWGIKGGFYLQKLFSVFCLVSY